MNYIIDTILRSVIVYFTIYAWQLIKYAITKEINTNWLEIIVSAIIGWKIATKFINWFLNK